jgi:hypothetical protein
MALVQLTQEIEDRLQADGHRISQAIELSAAFNEGYVESTLLRSLVAAAVSSTGVPVVELANGGRDIIVPQGERHLIFRLKKAERDALGLRVLAGSDSVFSAPVGQGSMFPTLVPNDVERWVLALIFDDDNMLVEAVAARPIGFRASRPGRLLFDQNQFSLPIGSPSPPSFDGDDEDLEIPDEGEEEGGQAAG